MWSGFDTAPIVAMQTPCTMRSFARRQAQDLRIASVAADELARRRRPNAPSGRPCRGFSSILWMIVPTGIAFSGIALPGFTSTRSPAMIVSPAFRRCGAMM